MRKRRNLDFPIERVPRERAARGQLRAFEFKKRGFRALICATPTISQLR
jgi:hypothetical protein